MSTERLQRFKNVTFWCGVLVTFCGIVLNVASGGSLWSGALALFGLLLTCCSYWFSSALAKHQAAEKAADRERIAEFTARIDYAEQTLDNPDLKRTIQKEASRYADEHQDDGR